jgi:hypothetical protein
MLKIKEILSCIVLAFLMLAMISIPEKKGGQNTHLTFSLPNNTSNHFYIDAFSIITNSVFDELFVVKDAQVVKETIDFLNKAQTNSKTKFTTIGIDFFSPIEIIGMSFKTENIIIVRANLASKEKFEKNSHKLGLKNFVLNNECYIILKGDINTQNLKSDIKNNLFKFSTSRKQEDIIWSQFEGNHLIQDQKLIIKSKEIIAKIRGIKKNKQESQKNSQRPLYDSLPKKVRDAIDLLKKDYGVEITEDHLRDEIDQENATVEEVSGLDSNAKTKMDELIRDCKKANPNVSYPDDIVSDYRSYIDQV